MVLCGCIWMHFLKPTKMANFFYPLPSRTAPHVCRKTSKQFVQQLQICMKYEQDTWNRGPRTMIIFLGTYLQVEAALMLRISRWQYIGYFPIDENGRLSRVLKLQNTKNFSHPFFAILTLTNMKSMCHSTKKFDPLEVDSFLSNF